MFRNRNAYELVPTAKEEKCRGTGGESGHCHPIRPSSARPRAARPSRPRGDKTAQWKMGSVAKRTPSSSSSAAAAAVIRRSDRRLNGAGIACGCGMNMRTNMSTRGADSRAGRRVCLHECFYMCVCTFAWLGYLLNVFIGAASHKEKTAASCQSANPLFLLPPGLGMMPVPLTAGRRSLIFIASFRVLSMAQIAVGSASGANVNSRSEACAVSGESRVRLTSAACCSGEVRSWSRWVYGWKNGWEAGRG